ncbi:lipocalin family protein [Maribacter halichondriae]|uniref:lipocalin family protein n=1 Tax=Maribacter halichondriae TaxID=2980554 RepID=UPI002359E39D|nr:lipocalin family protein [Maribacter sp. Hal144]
MQKYFIPIVLLLFLSCDKDVQENAVPLNAGQLVGSWQIVSESYSIGGPQIENDVENGGIYTFGLDGTFTFVYEKDTSLNFAGTFTFEEVVLTLNYIRDNEDV